MSKKMEIIIGTVFFYVEPTIKHFHPLLFHVLNLLLVEHIYLLVCSYPINVKTSEPIGPKFCVGPYMNPGKVYGWSKLKKLASNKIRFLLNFEIHDLFSKISELLKKLYTKRTCSIEIEDGREAPWKPSSLYFRLFTSWQ